MPDQRDRILDATLSLMARVGAHGTSMRAVASACGLNVATLYHYFPSKHDLLQAGRRDEFARTSAALLAAGAKIITIAFAAIVGRMRRRHAAAARRTVEKSFQQSSKTVAGQSAFGVTMTAQRFLYCVP